jgi:SPP1 gp7 family putative phage head morphogenesis protein
MGLFDRLIGKAAQQNIEPTEPKLISRVRDVEVKTFEIGTTGTEINSGYLNEEYLGELQGKDWADKIDMMRRSDTNVRMVLNAIKLPLKSSPWDIAIKSDCPEELKEQAEHQQLLLKQILFSDLNKSFTALIGEILTCMDFGYSLFDITHSVKTDKKLGTYNSLKSIAYRSQRTIERWNVDPSGDLNSVTQNAYGDLGGSFELDARFLLHFAPEKEGDNFEGISILRACYGPWFRKNVSLKKLAIGIEKYSVPTPTVETPDGAENSKEYAAIKNALRCYNSGENNFLIHPKGYKISFNNVTIDVDKIRKAIDAENQEMVNSILASFLLLGQNGAGSLALSGDLSNFFAQTIQYIADHISEQFERKIFKSLMQMNYGNDEVLVELKCDGLEHRATMEWSNMVNAFIQSGAIVKDEDLEVNLREKLKLPAKMKQEEIQIAPEQDPLKPQLADKKKSKNTPQSNLIRKTADQIRSVSKSILPEIAGKYVNSVMIQARKANESNKIKAPINASVPSIAQYISILKTPYFIAAIEADSIQEKVFKSGKKIRLSEFNLAANKLKRVADAIEEYEDALKRLTLAVTKIEKEDAIYALGRISDKVNLIFSEYMSYSQKQNIAAKAEVFAETQKNDILKAVDLQFQSSLKYADDDQLEQDILDAAEKTIDGAMTNAGPDVQAGSTVNDGLKDAADKYEEETGNKILSYTFVAVDDDVTTDICRELNGSVFSADDPDMEKFSPPLHFNCRSFMSVNTSNMKQVEEITGSPKLSKAAQSQIQFAESQKTHTSKKIKYRPN